MARQQVPLRPRCGRTMRSGANPAAVCIHAQLMQRVFDSVLGLASYNLGLRCGRCHRMPVVA